MKLNWYLMIWILGIAGFSCSSSKKAITEQEQNDFVLVNGLFWSKYEVTNQEFASFLLELKDLKKKDYEQCKIQNEKWSQVEDLGNALSRNYHNHPAFNNYPVVNVSFYGARQYCEWLTRNAKEHGGKQLYRLPTLDEFKELYQTLSLNTDTSKVDPEFKMNLKYSEGRAIDGGEVTVPARPARSFDGKPFDRFKQNKYGLYHIIGNVSEYTSDGNAIGGDWNTFPGRSMNVLYVDQPSPRVGFRVVMEKLKN